MVDTSAPQQEVKTPVTPPAEPPAEAPSTPEAAPAAEAPVDAFDAQYVETLAALKAEGGDALDGFDEFERSFKDLGNTDPDPMDEAETPEPAAAPPEPEPTPPAEPPQQQQQQQQPIMIPKGRFDEVVQDARSLNVENIQLKERLRIQEEQRTQAQPQGQAPGQQPPPAAPPQQWDPQAEIAAERQKLNDAAAQVDEGELSMVKYRQLEDSVDDKIQEIRAEVAGAGQQQMSRAEIVQDVRREMAANDPWLVNQNAKVSQQNPWLNQATPQQQGAMDRELKAIGPAALALIRNEYGYTGALDTPAGRLTFNVAMVDMAHRAGIAQKWGSTMNTASPNQQQATTPTPPANVPPVNPQVDPAIEARRAAIARTNNHPPDLTGAGSAAPPGPGITAEDFSHMSNSERDQIPAHVMKELVSAEDAEFFDG